MCAPAFGTLGGLLAVTLLVACDQQTPGGYGVPHINEVVSNNDGVGVDEHGETDDFIELINPEDVPIDLTGYTLVDGSGNVATLPSARLESGEVIVLWADDTPEQGSAHLPFKISSAGDRLELRDAQARVLDVVEVPALELNDSYARLPDGDGELAVCRYATPGRGNGQSCGPAPAPELPDDARFQPFDWPEPFAAPRGPLVLSELALRPARFIEVLNASDERVDLSAFRLRVAPHAPGLAWPSADAGVDVVLPDALLEAGERIAVALAAEHTQALEADEAFEGVVTLFDAEGAASDRLDFMWWPEGAALARNPDASAHPRFCATLTEGEPNDGCDALASRPVGDRLRHFYTRGDFDALAAGDTSQSARGVKFVLDMQAGDVVHLLGSERWPLHFTFIRELIDGQPELDRCDPMERQTFDAGWQAFSDREYFRTEGRRYLLGTLNAHSGTDLRTLDFTLGDQIVGAQMQHAFFAVMAHVGEHQAWSLRPTEPRQTQELLGIDGRAPIVPMNAPFRGVTYQALTEGVGFGVLTFVPAVELGSAALSRDVIVLTDDVPNDIPFVGGLITEAFQTPLAHVNVLSKNRGTPNMALRAARQDPRLFEHLGELVRLEVATGDFNVRRATAEEADAFYRLREPTGMRIAPRLDLSVRGVQPLSERSLADLPVIGAKAAQLAELARVATSACGGPMPLPEHPFAIPLVHYVEHFEASGAAALVQALLQDAEARTDPAIRAQALAEIARAITAHPVDPELLAEVEAAVNDRFGDARVRFRSSSNTEDLPTFNGAGLYTSISAELDDVDRRVDDALRVVWSSLWSLRAYDEREHAFIDQTKVAMAVLVHPAFLSERANAVAISRNVLDPIRSDLFYYNVQLGEASVANPAPGVTTEQLIHRRFPFPGSPEIEYQSQSSFMQHQGVMTLPELREASCFLSAIHGHFRVRLDPAQENRLFAVDIELKLIGPERELLIKQARPYSFGTTDLFGDCREL